MIEQLRKKIREYNESYRLGNPLISDAEYDQLIEKLTELSPNDELLTKVGVEITDSRKTKLDIDMASMNKIKSIEDIDDWARLKNIKKSEVVILTPKLDGISLAVDERCDKATTRGDGEFGQRSDEHYKLVKNHLKSNEYFDFTYGEVMMSKKIFLDKYSMDFANPRNLVAGLFNSPDPKAGLKDCTYIKYGAISDGPYNAYNFETKQEALDSLNENQEVTIPYHICKISDLTEDLLIDLFHKWGIEYEIDGVVIEINDLELQSILGRETSSNNPCYARAFKHESFTESLETEILGITWHISKNGLLKPVAQVNPIKLDGVIVSNCTLNNAKFVRDMGLGTGAVVKIIRSGMVIPKVVGVIKSVNFEIPVMNGIEIGWNDAGIELISLTETDEQSIKKIISFFEILEADNVGEGVVRQLYDSGYKTIKQILSLSKSDLEKIDRFGKRKSTIIYDSIKKSTSDVSLSKFQHASNLFENLGSKKLALLEHFTEKPTMEQLLGIEGFAEISSKSYLDGYDKFNEFIKDLPITIKKEKNKESLENDLEGMSFCFSGVRRKDLELIIENKSGKISSGVSKNTTHLVLKDLSSGSSKTVKAKELGIKILSVEELEKLLGL